MQAVELTEVLRESAILFFPAFRSCVILLLLLVAREFCSSGSMVSLAS